MEPFEATAHGKLLIPTLMLSAVPPLDTHWFRAMTSLPVPGLSCPV
jgi:hypothetical protein